MSVKNRDEIEDKYKWKIESMYGTQESWEKDYEKAKELGEKIPAFSGKLGESAETLLEALKMIDKTWQVAEKVFVYARMKRDEDNEKSIYQEMTDKCSSLFAEIGSNMAFFTPELLSIPEEKFEKFFVENKDLSVYRHFIESTLKEKAHILSETEENLLAQISQLNGGTNHIYTMLNNADMKFGKVKDEAGKEVELTHGNYIKFMESHNREVRKQAFETMYQQYKSLINTIATTYNYNTKTDTVYAKLRKYPSALESALATDNIDKKLYVNLIETVHKYLPVLHKYIKLRKKLLGVDDLKMYDMYVPLVKVHEKEISFEEGVEIMLDSLKPLGEDYVNRLKNGVESGWIDVFENKGKTSGAYSFGSYDSMPFSLLNYSGKLKDVFTLVHEMGHSMHSLYTREKQPYVYGGHSIFTAEVASTVNESLLINYLLKNAENKEMKKYLINTHIEAFRTTLFRQTMFAEFEMLSHEEIEKGGVLTAQWLSDTYDELNKKYFGEALGEDELIKYEWARIPHFYNAFYVYKYATGYSAATAICSKILNEGEKARDNYLEFLTTGESNYPIELLKIAGIDMSSPKPVEMAMQTFEDLVDEFERLVQDEKSINAI